MSGIVRLGTAMTQASNCSLSCIVQRLSCFLKNINSSLHQRRHERQTDAQSAQTTYLVRQTIHMLDIVHRVGSAGVIAALSIPKSRCCSCTGVILINFDFELGCSTSQGTLLCLVFIEHQHAPSIPTIRLKVYSQCPRLLLLQSVSAVRSS